MWPADSNELRAEIKKLDPRDAFPSIAYDAARKILALRNENKALRKRVEELEQSLAKQDP